jgi:prepilin-type N-terminal cleavage/methylation domain-containing protein
MSVIPHPTDSGSHRAPLSSGDRDRLPYTRASLLREDAGFTLMEVLVAMVVGVIVTGALFAILEVSLHQTARINDRVQATQLGRTAMTKMIDELHSGCLAREFAPVQAKSGPNELRFATGFSEKTTIEASEAYEHRIVWNEKEPGKLTDYTYNAEKASSWPTFKFETNVANKELVSENVYRQNVKSKAEETELKSSKIPFFQYYKYSTKASLGTSETASSTLTKIVLGEKETLTAEGAKSVAAVQVSFAQAPTDNDLRLSRAAEFNNLVTFAFASPASESTITDGPCQ